MSIATFTLKSATTNAAAEFSIGHAFRKGDVPAGSQLVSGLTDMQVVTKNSWPDGSLKFATISGLAPLVANTPLSVVLSIGTPAGGTALTTTDLKATGITATISTDAIGGGAAFGFASWATTDWDTPHQTWISGPKMSSWIYRKQIGTDAHLVAWLEVRLWANGEVEVLPWVENGYFRVAAPTNKNAVYGFYLGGLHLLGVTVDLKHHQRTVLINGSMLSYWLGVDPGVTPLVDPVYMMATELVPTYSAVLAAGAVRVGAQVTSYAPLQQGNFDYSGDSMPQSGYQRPIGLLPEHDVLYLVANAADRPAMYASVVRNGYSAGRYSIHFRDEATQRPPAFSTYTTLVLNGGVDSGIKDTGGSTTSTYSPLPTGGNGPTWDASHSPSVGYMAYLLTGRFYFKEEVQFATTVNHFHITDWVRGGGTGQTGYTPRPGFTGASGICNSVVQTRQGAWRFRTLAQALVITPDSGDPLRAELIASVEANCEYFHQIYVAQANNPFGIIESSELYTDIATDRLMVPIWQHDFGTAAWGMALAFDLPVSSTYKTKMIAFFAWKAKSVIHRLGTSAGFRFERAGVYEYAASPNTSANFQLGTGPWFADDAAAYAGTSVNYQNVTPVDNVLYLNSNDFGPPERSVWGNLVPAIAYAARHAVIGAAAAYARLTGASNYSTLVSGFNTTPVWSVAPAALSEEAPLMGLGKVTRADSNDFINGIVVCGFGGDDFGILASEIPTGFANASMLLNDVDGADPANTVYRLRALSGPNFGKLVINPDGTQQYTPTAGFVGVSTGTTEVWKNNELAYITDYSYTSGSPAGVVNLIAANCTQAHTSSSGAIIIGTIPTITLVAANCAQANNSSSGAISIVEIPVINLAAANCTQFNQSSSVALIDPDGYIHGVLYPEPAVPVTYTVHGGRPYILKHPGSEMYFGVDLVNWLITRQTTLVSVTAVAEGITVLIPAFVQGNAVLAKFGAMDEEEEAVNSCTFYFTCDNGEVGVEVIHFEVWP
jgi:hypothetical protein